MKILLTGADGFTGRAFSNMARAAGHEVLPLSADLTHRAEVLDNVQSMSPDAVVHLAAISFVGHTDENAFYAVNVVGTTNLLTALAQLPVKPRQVLLVSSANIYGNSEASPLIETQTPAPVSHYAMSKLAMEQMARPYANQFPLVIARAFNYTGPGQSTEFVIAKIVDHFIRRASTISLGNLHVEREVNDIQTVCETYLHLLRYGEKGETYNVCTGQPYTLQHVIDTLTRITAHQIQVEVNPAFVRANEVHRLYGCPDKLQALMAGRGVTLVNPPLENTLRRMLKAATVSD